MGLLQVLRKLVALCWTPAPLLGNTKHGIAYQGGISIRVALPKSELQSIYSASRAAPLTREQIYFESTAQQLLILTWF